MPPAAGSGSLGSSDVDRFVEKRSEDWKRLGELLSRNEAHGPRELKLHEVRELGRLYRATCADLLVARGELMDAALADYLDTLVARAYSQVYAERSQSLRRAWHFVWDEFPALVRREWRFVALAAALMTLGALVGALVVATDNDALAVVVPDMHLDQTPTERIEGERIAGEHDAGRSAVFSSFLFTHNIQVTFLVFALGVTFGLGTAGVLFWNGIPIGALAAQYHRSHEALFFWAWILPHGVVELTVVMIAGAAGFVLSRGLWLPGPWSRQAALTREARTAVRLVLGGMPMLVVAGLVEGTLSQMHAPLIPYWVKLTFAAALFLAMLAYLQRKERPFPEDEP
ncbi:MAG: stage II sporulation protein M [Myxococcales bacterium]